MRREWVVEYKQLDAPWSPLNGDSMATLLEATRWLHFVPFEMRRVLKGAPECSPTFLDETFKFRIRNHRTQEVVDR